MKEYVTIAQRKYLFLKVIKLHIRNPLMKKNVIKLQRLVVKLFQSINLPTQNIISV